MKRVRTALVAFVPVFLAFAPAAPAQPQPIVLPDASPKASVRQTVGLADFEVTYHRPAVNKRKVWGALVPYGDVWRAGANENTTLAASTPFTFGGKAVPAGTYGLHMLPSEGEWTVILSSESKAWGSYSYDKKEDVVRVSVRPEPAEFVERLAYTFDEPTNDATALALRWEKLRVAVPIGIDAKQVTLASLREQLRGLPRFSWQGWNQAAGWCARNDVTTDEAMAWADRSIKMQKTFANLRTKAALLEKKGDAKTAAQLRAEAMPLATEVDVNTLGYQLLADNKTAEALEMFRKNTKDHPQSWNVWDSLAEGLEKSGDKKGARENYQKALTMAPEDQKKRLNDTIARLK
jgi:tetratricopeptide (TPR) repeat protein